MRARRASRSRTPTSTARCRASRCRTRCRWTSCASACARGHRLRPLSRQPARPADGRAHPRARGLPAHPHHRPGSRPPGRPAARGGPGRRRAEHRADPGHLPEGASTAEREARRARAEGAQSRVRKGEDFATVARELSEDGNRAKGGEIGLRRRRACPICSSTRCARWPRARSRRPWCAAAQAFTCSSCSSGAMVPRCGCRRRGPGTSCCARRRSCRPRPRRRGWPEMQAPDREPARAASRTWRATVSDDGSAPTVATWAGPGPGQFVPEFDEAMNKLAVNGISRRWCRVSACT
jgi:hypothetical protein